MLGIALTFQCLYLTVEAVPVLVYTICVIMAALHSRCGRYVFALWLLSFCFSSPVLGGFRSDVCHTLTHDVAFVRI